MVKYILISLFIIFCWQFSIAQNNSKWQIDTHNLKEIYLNQLDQLYFEYHNGNLITNTKLQTRDYYRDYGPISSIDIRNPQKILLFYRDFQRIIILDNTLSDIQEINLEDISTGIISLAIMSKMNDIWLYDEVKNALVRINNNGRVLTETEPLYYYKSSFIPSKLQLINQKVMLSNNSGDALFFDNFGQLIKDIKIPCQGKFNHGNSKNYCLDNKQLKIFNPSDKNYENEIESLADTSRMKTISDVRFFSNNNTKLIYLKKNGELEIVQ